VVRVKTDEIGLITHHPWYPTMNLFLIVVGSALGEWISFDSVFREEP